MNIWNKTKWEMYNMKILIDSYCWNYLKQSWHHLYSNYIKFDLKKKNIITVRNVQLKNYTCGFMLLKLFEILNAKNTWNFQCSNGTRDAVITMKKLVTLRQVEVKIKSVLENCLDVLPFVGTEIRSTHGSRHFEKKTQFFQNLIWFEAAPCVNITGEVIRIPF